MPGRPTALASQVNLNLMRSLAILLEERSVSRAAARLGVTQSAASHALGQLRDLLGDPLLVRGPSGMLPTPRAEQLAPRIQRALAELERALAEVVEFDPATAERTFTLAAGDHMAGVILQAMVWMGLHEAPGVGVRIVPFEPLRLATQLEHGEVDVAVGPSIADRVDVRQQFLFSDRLACIVRKDHPEIRGEVTLDQLGRLPHVVLSRDDESLRRVEEALQKRGVKRRAAVELPYFLLAPSLIPFAELLLIGPHTLGALFALGYPLEVLELPIEVPDMRVHAYWHERFEADPGHRWLRQQVRRGVKDFFVRTGTLSSVVVGTWPEPLFEHRAES